MDVQEESITLSKQLPDVLVTVSTREKSLDDNSEKHKHKKKSLKKHKKRKRKHSCSHHESEDTEWVEKQSLPRQNYWMDTDFLSGMHTISSKEAKSSKMKQSVEPVKPFSIDGPGKHEKEINPFWKDGGTGLPENNEQSSCQVDAVPNLDWLQLSLKRMEEQCAKSGCDIESIAAERYGSWQQFQDMLVRAKSKSYRHTYSDSGIKISPGIPSTSRRFLKPSETETNKGLYTSKNRQLRGSVKYNSSFPENSKRWKKIKPTLSLASEEITKLSKEKEHTIVVNETKLTKSLPVGPTSTPSHADDDVKNKTLPEEERNIIAAKIIKAELMGNTALLQRLKKKLGSLDRTAKEIITTGSTKHKKAKATKVVTSESDEEFTILTRTTKTGQSWPIREPETSRTLKTQKILTTSSHDSHEERGNYFADDDMYSLNDLVKQERSGTSEEPTKILSHCNSKLFSRTNNDDFTLDDMFESEAGKITVMTKDGRCLKQQAIASQKKLMRRLDKCKYCFGNSENPKHLIVAIGRAAYLRLPSHSPLQTGHCIIAPMHHVASGTNLDEDVWGEIRQFMVSLYNMFTEQGKDCVFLQTCIGLNQLPHFYVECVPLAKEVADLAPLYFKKAIQECETEWSHNRKLIDTLGKTVRDKVPVGLPYFSVDFGLGGGYAHVVEDEDVFPSYFGREILGGMLDVGPELWRKPRDEYFNEQTKRALEFAKWYQKFDWIDNKKF